MSIKTWWPTESEWRKGGLNIGYWSERCEAWYQERLQKIMRGEAQPLTSPVWRQNLMRDRNTYKVMDNLEKASKQYLDKGR